MKSVIKKLVAGVLSASMIFAGAVVINSNNMATVEAASKSAIKNLNISWDIKPDKTVPIYTKVYGMDKLQKQKGTITNFRRSSKNGTTTVKFRAVIERDYWNISSDQVIKMNNDDIFGGGYYFAIVDYKTGENLEYDGNKYGVKVTGNGWKIDESKGQNYYYGYDATTDYTVWFDKRLYADVKITYPSDYDDLCIAVGGNTDAIVTDNDNAFWEGKKTFKDTTYYSDSNKKVAHFMRLDNKGNYTKK